jgi:DAK2 domain fusion protein YloV
MAERTSTTVERRTCDGHDLQACVWAGLAWLERHYEEVNALNVFPVPDGDTGTNMMLTMRSAHDEVSEVDEDHAGQVAQKIYNGALMGARGNSGVILSQLWRGFARGIERMPAFDASALVRGFQEAVRMAYQAVQEPVEGTMLTVASDISQEAEAAVKETTDVVAIMERVVERAHVSVRRTPELLAVLAEAGVVDAGGMGLAYILEGILRHMRGESLETAGESREADELQSALSPEDEEGYGYDVQYLIRGQSMDVNQVRAQIESLGWSTLVVGGEDLIKVHVHVHNPGEVLGYGASVGSLDDIVVENMQAQYETFVRKRGAVHEEERVVDEALEPPAIQEGTIAAVAVAPGDGLKRILYSLGAGYVIPGGQTMNPSTKDIVEAIETLPTDKVVLLPNNKNIFMAAEQAAGRVDGKTVRVVPTRTIPQGISALLALDPHGELDEVVDVMVESSGMVETGEVTTATRDTRVNGVRVRKGQTIGLYNDDLIVVGNDVSSVVADLLREMGIDDLELVTLYYGADIDRSEAQMLTEHLRDEYPDHEIELREGGQPHYYYILSAE